MTQIERVYKVIKDENRPLTSAEIKAMTDLTSKQVSQALSTLKLKGLIVPEREIDLTEKPYNRYTEKPQRWAMKRGIFDGTND